MKRIRYILLCAALLVNDTLIGMDSNDDDVMMQLKKVVHELEQSGRSALIASLVNGLTFKVDNPHCCMPEELLKKLSLCKITDNKGCFVSPGIRQRISAIMHNQQLYEKLIQSEEQ